MELRNIKNFSQAERLEMAKQLLDSVWEEMRDDQIDGLTMTSVAMDCSIQSRRIA